MRKLVSWKYVPYHNILIVAFFLQNALDEATEPWGIKVERVEM